MSLVEPRSLSNQRQLRYAVVGLGWIAQEDVLPAFGHTENAELVAFVSDDPTKIETLSQKYGVQHSYSYEEYEKCLMSGEIDAVYIALPNHLHCEYTVRAAKAGIHILCEKPMAVTQTESEQMIQAAQEHHVKLMIAYRLHFDKANLEAVRIVKSGELGDIRIFNSVFSQQVVEDNIRMELMDKDPEPSGKEGLIDVCIIQAIYQSAQMQGQAIKLPEFVRSQRPDANQIIQRPAVQEQPDLIHAADPSSES